MTTDWAVKCSLGQHGQKKQVNCKIIKNYELGEKPSGTFSLQRHHFPATFLESPQVQCVRFFAWLKHGPHLIRITCWSVVKYMKTDLYRLYGQISCEWLLKDQHHILLCHCLKNVSSRIGSKFWELILVHLLSWKVYFAGLIKNKLLKRTFFKQWLCCWSYKSHSQLICP